MRLLSGLALCFCATAAPVACAQDEASSVRALEHAYAQYARRFESRPPRAFEDYYRATLRWDGLESQQVDMNQATGGTSRVRAGGRDGAPSLMVTLDEPVIDGPRAYVSVHKRVAGTLPGPLGSKPGRVRGEAVERHVWQSTGASWVLVRIEPESASLTLEGKVFTPMQRGYNPNGYYRPFDPNRSFRDERVTPAEGLR